MDRRIALEGADNARDLGGLPAAGGARIRRKRLLRSNHLARLTERDIEVLRKEYRLARIIDLRTDGEIKEAGDVSISGVEQIHIPIFTEQMIGITHEKSADRTMADALSDMPGMEDMYRMMVNNPFSCAQFGKVLKAVSETPDGAVLWHCTEGKDRCGLVSALLELCLGVDLETVYEDYLLTNEASAKRSEAMRGRVLERTGDVKAADRAASLFLAKREYLAAAIHEMIQTSGSAAYFLKEHIGITAAEKEALREKFLIIK